MEVSFIANNIAAYGEAKKLGVCFLWGVVGEDAKVSGFLTNREFTGKFKNNVFGTNSVVIFESIKEAW